MGSRLALSVTLAALAGPVPAADPVPPPRLATGDELHYTGTAVEAGEGTERFRKTHDLEVRVLVIDGRPGGADCAVLTRVHPRLDAVVSGSVATSTGGPPERPPAAVRVDYVRVDYRGRVTGLRPPPGPPPVPTGPGVPTAPLAAGAVDGPPLTEVGMFVPLPADSSAAGWFTTELGRPPVAWRVAGDVVWNGGRCVDVRRTQETAGYDRPADAVTGWRRTDTLAVSPADGLAGRVERRTERRHGRGVVGWVTVSLERRPAGRLTGPRGRDARREAELAVAAAGEFDALVRDSAPAAAFEAAGNRLDRAATGCPVGAFQDGLTAARRKLATAAAGDVPPAEPAVEPPQVGDPAPDFAAQPVGGGPPVRLAAWRGAPAVVVFYRPESKTAPEALAVADALHAKYAGRVPVVALAVYAPPAAAGRERTALKLGVPVADGAAAQIAFGVTSHPRFVVVGRDGAIAWDFTGVGPEVGFLVREQVDRAAGR